MAWPWSKVKSWICIAHRRGTTNALPFSRKSALISANQPDSQASANTARPRDTGWCTTWYACLLPSFRWYQIILLGDRGSRVWTTCLRLLRSSVTAWVQGSLKVIENGTIRKLGYGFLFAFHSNYGRILYRFRDTAKYKSKIAIFSYPLALDAPVRGFSSKNCHNVWCCQNSVGWLPDMKKFDDMLSRFDRNSRRSFW